MPCSSGDVQMRPAVFLGEASQEAGGSDGTRSAAADVGHVCKVTVQQGLVLLPNGQAPSLVVGTFTRSQQFVCQLVIVGHQACCLVAKGNDAGAGKRDRKSVV